MKNKPINVERLKRAIARLTKAYAKDAALMISSVERIEAITGYILEGDDITLLALGDIDTIDTFIDFLETIPRRR